MDRICAPLFSRQRHPMAGAAAVGLDSRRLLLQVQARWLQPRCFPSVSRFFAGVLSFVVRGHGVVRSARRSFVRSSSSFFFFFFFFPELKAILNVMKKIELDCDREKQKKKGKRKRQHKSFRFLGGCALCVQI